MATTAENKTFRIFISHKQEDHLVADATKKALEKLKGKFPVKCFVSGSDIPAGTDWNSFIKSQLSDSHLLLLLFTNPSKNWDWCLYEAGLFSRFDKEDVTSVVCIFNPEGTPPAPLNNLQGVPARDDKIRDFLTRLYKTPWEISDDWHRGPLYQGVKQEQITETAKSISQTFKRLGPYYPCHRLVLDMGHVEQIGDAIPEDSRVLEGADGTSSYTLSLFGLAEGPKERTWGDLLHALNDHDGVWRRQLDQAFCMALHEELFEPVSATLRSWNLRRCYKPILYRVLRAHEITQDGQAKAIQGQHAGSRTWPAQVTIVFERVDAPASVRDPVFNLIRILTRYRIEVFETFGGHLAELEKASPGSVFDNLRDVMRLLNSDAEEHGWLETAHLRAAFGADYEEAGLEAQKTRWLETSARIEQALTKPDAEMIEQLLADMRTINHALSIAATERYLKVLAEST